MPCTRTTEFHDQIFVLYEAGRADGGGLNQAEYTSCKVDRSKQKEFRKMRNLHLKSSPWESVLFESDGLASMTQTTIFTYNEQLDK